jgi:methyl-accepting chemotaxis protein
VKNEFKKKEQYMNWFKNLKAMPRLMGSFGVLLALTLGIGYLAINSLSKANDRVQGLYQDDMKGIMAIENIAIAKIDIARQDRDAIIFIDNQAIVDADLESLKKDYVTMNANLQAAEQYFHSKEEKAILAQMQETLPGYLKGVDGIVDGILAKDTNKANARQTEMAGLSAQMLNEIQNALKIKETLSEQKFQANNEAYRAMRSTILGVSVAALLLGVIMSFVIARGFSVPLGHAVIALEKVAAGDLTASLDVNTHDEVGQMGAALNRAVEKLNSTMREVADGAANASSSSQQLAAASEAIASGAQEQAASLEETSASLEEITATVRQSADNAQQASQLASGSKDSALQGQEVVSKAITAMSEINVASAKISDIISTIDEIAFQTNLLAVNAAVEAARAGDEGRGFAVVASEVRSLAQRSAVAAKEIKVLIQDSLRKVEAGSVLVNRSGETLQGIVGSVKRVTDIVGEIAAASGEQSTGIEQVSTAMTQMDQVTQSNSAQTEELSATAEALSEQAARLLELVGTFTLSHSESGQRDRQAYESYSASHVNFAKQPSPVQSMNSAAHLSTKSLRSNGAAKSDSNARDGKRPKSRQSTLAIAVPSEQTLKDASFQEF